ncbi:MAG: aconitase X, partial [Actinomycetota bacterium]
MRLSDWDRALLAGAEGPAGRLAMRIVVEMARVAGAAGLIDVTSAHIDG